MKILILLVAWSLLALSAGNNCYPNPFVQSLNISSPFNGSLVPSQFQMRLAASAFNAEEFNQRNDEFYLCYSSILLGKEEKIIFSGCGMKVFDTNMIVTEPGVNRLQVSLIHGPTEQQLCVDEIKVECCKQEDIDEATQLLQNRVFSYISDMKLLATKSKPLSHKPIPNPFGSSSVNKAHHDIPHHSKKVVRVFIGIKTFALNLHLRQAIRNTYFHYFRNITTDLHHGLSKYRFQFHPTFLIGYNSLEGQYPELSNALLEEQCIYQDLLLLDTLPALDTYFTLPDKVLYYFHYLQQHYFSSGSSLAGKDFVLITDDDTYLHIPQIVTLLHNLLTTKPPRSAYTYYGGEVLQQRMHFKYRPQRSRHHLNYLSLEDFPHESLPPFALGNCYILSSYLMLELMQRKYSIQPIGTLEDLSVGIWLQQMLFKEGTVKVQHLPGVCELPRCALNPNLFISPELHSVEDMFLAIAGIREERHFQLLHQVLNSHAKGWSAPVLQIEGDEETTQREEEEVRRLRTQYIWLLHVLQTIREEQFDPEPHISPETADNKNNNNAASKKTFSTSKFLRPHPLLHPTMTIGLQSNHYRNYSSMSTPPELSYHMQSWPSRNRSKPLRIVWLLIDMDDWPESTLMQYFLTWFAQGSDNMKRGNKTLEIEIVIGTTSMSPSIYRVLKQFPFPVRLRYFSLLGRKQFSTLQSMFSTIHIPSSTTPSMTRTKTSSFTVSEMEQGLLLLKYLLSFDVFLVPEPISFHSLATTDNSVYMDYDTWSASSVASTQDIDRLQGIYTFLVQVQVMAYTNYRRREDFVGHVPQVVIVDHTILWPGKNELWHKSPIIPSFFSQDKTEKGDLLLYRVFGEVLSAYWSYVWLLPSDLSLNDLPDNVSLTYNMIASFQSIGSLSDYCWSRFVLTKQLLHEDYISEDGGSYEESAFPGNPILFHPHEDTLLYSLYPYTQVFFHHLFARQFFTSLLLLQLYLPFSYSLSPEPSTTTLFAYEDYLHSYFHHYRLADHQLHESTTLFAHTMMFHTGIVLVDSLSSAYPLPWMVSWLRQCHPALQLRHFYLVHYHNVGKQEEMVVYVKEMKYSLTSHTFDPMHPEEEEAHLGWERYEDVIHRLTSELLPTDEDNLAVVSLSTSLDCMVPTQDRGLVWTTDSQVCYHTQQQALKRGLSIINKQQGRMVSIWVNGEPQEILPWDTTKYHAPDVVFQSYHQLNIFSPSSSSSSSPLELYLPIFFTIFYEPRPPPLVSSSETNSSNSNLLMPQPYYLLFPPRDNMFLSSTNNGKNSKTHGIAYLYYRCDRAERERLYALLFTRFQQLQQTHQSSRGETIHQVDALGLCQGKAYLSQQPEANEDESIKQQQRFSQARFRTTYNTDAITLYRKYKFVIAVENTYRPGYVTEKLLHAYLANAIPIYLGDPEITKYFNPKSMISCHAFSSLESCVDHVVYVHTHEEEYERMLSVAPIRGHSLSERLQTWSELFAWHEASAGTSAANLWKERMSNKLMELLF